MNLFPLNKPILWLKLITLPAVILFGLALTACNKVKLEIRENFPFEIAVLPVPKAVKMGDEVEIRMRILPTGSFKETKYFIRYFQFDGTGALRYYHNEPYRPNDIYLLADTQFRLYYTATSTVTQSFDIWITDNFDNEQKITFEFKSSD